MNILAHGIGKLGRKEFPIAFQRVQWQCGLVYVEKKKKRHIWRQDHRAECLLYTEGAEDKAPQSVAPESILPPLLQEPLLSGAHSAHHAPQVLQRLHRPHRLLKDTVVCRGP